MTHSGFAFEETKAQRGQLSGLRCQNTFHSGTLTPPRRDKLHTHSGRLRPGPTQTSGLLIKGTGPPLLLQGNHSSLAISVPLFLPQPAGKLLHFSVKKQLRPFSLRNSLSSAPQTFIPWLGSQTRGREQCGVSHEGSSCDAVTSPLAICAPTVLPLWPFSSLSETCRGGRVRGTQEAATQQPCLCVSGSPTTTEARKSPR